MESFGHIDAKYVWRKKGEAYKPKNTVPTVRYGDGSIMGVMGMFLFQWHREPSQGPRNNEKGGLHQDP